MEVIKIKYICDMCDYTTINKLGDVICCLAGSSTAGDFVNGKPICCHFDEKNDER